MLADHLISGIDILHDPDINKGTAFTEAERDVLGLRGLLPPNVATVDEQLQRVREGLHRKTSDLETVSIPANRYPIGDDSNAIARPKHHVELAAFAMMLGAVTNEHYKHFVEADGYQQQSYWSEMGWRWLKSKRASDLLPYWREGRFSQLTQPVVGVGWYEAQAFAAWLRTVTDKEWRLPTEAEWEASARGDDAPIHGTPNTANSATGRPLAVLQVGTIAWCGAVNLTGNVWEWCSTRWGRNWQSLDYPYPYQPDDGREDPTGSYARVMRGGSWFDAPQQSTPIARARYLPGSRGSNIGFRLVYSVHKQYIW